MNIYESRKVMPNREMNSAGRLSDSWPMPEESGRQINKSQPRGCDWVTEKRTRALKVYIYSFLCSYVSTLFYFKHQPSSKDLTYSNLSTSYTILVSLLPNVGGE